MSEIIDELLNQVEWTKLESFQQDDDGDVYVTHSGVLSFGQSEFKVYRLNTGEAVIDADDMDKFLCDLEG